MNLEKFYVDVVGADGGGCIGYAARLDGFGLGATLGATLHWEGDAVRTPEQHRTLRGTLPERAAHGLVWKCAGLGVTGKWSPHDPDAIDHVLWRDGHGEVRWQVLASRAAVKLQLGDRTIAGWGYAERLRMNVPPWRLPIDALRWGRFVSPEHSVAWIDWEHPTPRRWLWREGIAQSDVSHAPNGVRWLGGALTWADGRMLRNGRLGSTVLARWPRVQRWLPQRILSLDETKWCAPATLSGTTHPPVRGWVIHEHVRLR